MPIILLSPLAGWVAGLDEVPDEVFAGRVLGAGLAIDPKEGVLCAPCEGEVITVAPTGHAVAVRGMAGVEVLIHVGIDTVVLKGEGFQLHVAVGQAVKAGDPLLTFDLDKVARGARSLITPVLVTNGERFEIVRRAEGPIQTGETLLELRERAGAPSTTGATVVADASSICFITGLAEGVHARPAARIVMAARAAGVEVTVGAHGRTTSAYSALGLMGLGVRKGDEVTLTAAGPAGAAFTAIRTVFEGSAAAAPAHAARRTRTSGTLVGVRGAGGVAIGKTFRYLTAEITFPREGLEPAKEARALQSAIASVADTLDAISVDGSSPRDGVLAAHRVLLDDPVLIDPAKAAIEGGASAGEAWRTAVHRQANLFGAADDRRLRERRADLLDLERQVLAQLYGTPEPPKPPSGAIVLAAELLPSELAALVDQGVAGVAMAGGGATSHVAIMAAAHGLPLLAAIDGLEDVADGFDVILDADAGRLIIAPEPSVTAHLQRRVEHRRRRREAASAQATEPCITTDGVRVAVLANLGGGEDVNRALAAGAEGCGLLRSEFLFQDRASPPDEDEQHAAYQAVADRLGGRPLTIRTLDIGGDKPAPYLALPFEDNPALGLRGVRVSLWRPDLLRIQLRALLRVQGDVSILVPMVVSRHEIAAVRSLLVEEAAALAVQAPALGVMVETPAAALTVASLAEEADFFSIGANDLTQYALAMDRTLPMLAGRLDGLHPAVVALMRMTTQAAAASARKVSVCGGLAADLVAIPMLIGLGVAELSMPAGEIAEAKALIRTLSAGGCRAFAETNYPDAAALRQAVLERWPRLGDAP